MYILINEDNRPFAIITKLEMERIVTAIEEEFMVKDVVIDKIPNVDWGETKEFGVKAKDLDEGYEISYSIEISKIVEY